MEGAAVYLHLMIETGSDPIAGSVASPGQEPRRFGGWIELVATIEGARSSIKAPAECGDFTGAGEPPVKTGVEP